MTPAKLDEQIYRSPKSNDIDGEKNEGQIESEAFVTFSPPTMPLIFAHFQHRERAGYQFSG